MALIPPPYTKELLHLTATDLLSVVEQQFVLRPRETNIVSAKAFKVAARERQPFIVPFNERVALEWQGEYFDRTSCAHRRNFWITSWTVENGRPTLDFVLAVTDNHIGNYPIFIVSARPLAGLSSAYLHHRLSQLALRLWQCVSPERVFAVYAQRRVTLEFQRAWRHLVPAATPYPEPFYYARLLFLNRQMLDQAWLNASDRSRTPLPQDVRIRVAAPHDRYRISSLCKIFVQDSVYYTLNEPGSADRDAMELINHRQVWLCEAEGVSEALTMVAATRRANNVAAITKVFTHPDHRENGYAETLVRYVCGQLFQSGYTEVVLYVGHGLPAAKVYHRVGFRGLYGGEQDDWLEEGFQNADIEGGFW